MDPDIKCQHCGGAMARTHQGKSGCGLLVVALLLFAVGFLLLFVFPIGTLLGLALMLLSVRLALKKRRVWKCGRCGFFFERD